MKTLNENDALKFKTISAEEKAAKGILARLYGPVASCVVPTRNGRKYSEELWEKVFKNDIVKELFACGGLAGELAHPEDREETDPEKIAIMMPEPPVKDKDGHLVAYVDILDTPCGKIAYQLAKYGFRFGISSRGSGDLVKGWNGEDEVDPDSYTLNAFDLVAIPACKDARLTFVEGLDTKKNNKTLRESLEKTLDKANKRDRELMKEALDKLHILNEAASSSDVELVSNPETGLGLNDAQAGAVINNNRPVGDMKNSLKDEIQKTKSLIFGDIQLGKDEKPDDIKIVVDDENATFNDFFEGELTDENIPFTYNDEESTYFFRSNVEYKQAKEIIEDCLYDWQYQLSPTHNAIILMLDAVAPEEPVEDNEVINDENHNIKPEVTENRAVDNNKAMVEELQRLVKSNTILEQKVVNLQEKLSVSYAKETQLKEALTKSKSINTKASKIVENLQNQIKGYEDLTIRNQKALKESVKVKKQLTSQVGSNAQVLEEKNQVIEEKRQQLIESKAEIVSLRANIKKLNENISSQDKSLQTLQEHLKLTENKYKTELDKATKLTEKYKGIATEAVNRYIESQAIKVGCTVNEIKNRLPESYNFKDIDKACAEVQQYKLNINSLPINLTEGTRIKAIPSRNTTVIPQKDTDTTIGILEMSIAGFGD